MRANTAAVAARKPLLQLAPILIVLLFAAFLRLVALERQPLRGDEAFAWQNYMNRPLSESLREVAPIEPIPPGVYVLYRAWGVLARPDGIWLFRLLPSLSTLAGVAAVYSIGKRLGTRRLGVLASLIWAVLPYLIWHAKDARNYAPWVGFSALALAQGLRLLTRRKVAWHDWALYVLLAGTALSMAYQEVAFLLSLSIVAIWSRKGDSVFLRRWLTIQGTLLVLMALVFLSLQGDLLWGGSYGGNLQYSSLGALFELPAALLFGDILPKIWANWLGFSIWLVGGFSTLWLWRQEKPQQQTVVAVSLLVIPILLLSLAGLNWRVFHARYVLASAVGLVLLAALVLDQLLHRNRVLAAIVTLPLVLLLFYGLMQYYGPYRKAVDWGALVEWMSRSLSSADAVIQQSHDPAFSWHFEREATGAVEIALPIGPEQPSGEIEKELAALSAKHTTIWTIGREFQDWPNAGVTEKWLESERQIWLKGESDGIPYVAYLPVTPSASELHQMRTFVESQSFGLPPLVQLHGYLLDLTPAALVLRLYWLPLQQSEDPLTVFVHLVRDGELQPRAQADQTPRISTDAWPTGEIMREIYTLNTDGLPAGQYSLVVGWYDAGGGVRLPVNGTDSRWLTTISLP